MRPSSIVLFAAGWTCLLLPSWGKAAAPDNKTAAPAEKDPVACVLQFRFKNQEPSAMEKARRDIARAIEEDAKREYRRSDAENERAFADLLNRLRKTYGEFGSPSQKSILKEVDRYLTEITEKTPEGSDRFKVQPGVNLLKSIGQDLRTLDGASTAEAKAGSPWRTTFEQTKMTNILVAAIERKWGDEHFRQVEQILTDPEAARGLARFAGFYNRVTKELGAARTEEKVGQALDTWVVAPEEVKKELMQDPKLKEFLEDPAKYVEVYEARLVKEQGESSEKARRFRDEKTKNEARLQAMGKSCVKLFPGSASAGK
jgi:hypothetical protein